MEDGGWRMGDEVRRERLRESATAKASARVRCCAARSRAVQTQRKSQTEVEPSPTETMRCVFHRDASPGVVDSEEEAKTLPAHTHPPLPPAIVPRHFHHDI
eukprot:259947-Rhodomonas_salina.1